MSFQVIQLLQLCFCCFTWSCVRLGKRRGAPGDQNLCVHVLGCWKWRWCCFFSRITIQMIFFVQCFFLVIGSSTCWDEWFPGDLLFVVVVVVVVCCCCCCCCCLFVVCCLLLLLLLLEGWVAASQTAHLLKKFSYYDVLKRRLSGWV